MRCIQAHQQHSHHSRRNVRRHTIALGASLVALAQMSAAARQRVHVSGWHCAPPMHLPRRQHQLAALASVANYLIASACLQHLTESTIRLRLFALQAQTAFEGGLARSLYTMWACSNMWTLGLLGWHASTWTSACKATLVRVRG